MEKLARRRRMKNVDTTGPSDILTYRYLSPGLYGKMILTGTHATNRGGNAYCGGLIYFDSSMLDAQYKLSEMSRCYDTNHLAWRVELGGARDMSQEIYIGGTYSEAYAMAMPADRRPPSPQPKIFVYDDSRPAGVRDRYAFTFGGANISYKDHTFAPNQLYMLMLVGDGERHYVATLDPAAGAFADVMALPNSAMGFIKPSRRLIAAPDGRVMVYSFDNADGWLPVDFAEVTVERRAYRDGTSEYLLNGNKVRLMDLRDLLDGSGLGRDAYLVIGQGLVDQTLSLRPQERLALFEQAAGITPYRTRREDAVRHLEQTKSNLQRVYDIVGEIEPRAAEASIVPALIGGSPRVVADVDAPQITLHHPHGGDDLAGDRERVLTIHPSPPRPRGILPAGA